MASETASRMLSAASSEGPRLQSGAQTLRYAEFAIPPLPADINVLGSFLRRRLPSPHKPRIHEILKSC